MRWIEKTVYNLVSKVILYWKKKKKKHFEEDMHDVITFRYSYAPIKEFLKIFQFLSNIEQNWLSSIYTGNFYFLWVLIGFGLFLS